MTTDKQARCFSLKDAGFNPSFLVVVQAISLPYRSYRHQEKETHRQSRMSRHDRPTDLPSARPLGKISKGIFFAQACWLWGTEATSESQIILAMLQVVFSMQEYKRRFKVGGIACP